MTKPSDNPVAASIKRRIKAIAPFYYVYASEGLPRSTTFYALQSSLTGLVQLVFANLVPAPCMGLRLLFHLDVHPGLRDVVERDAQQVLASRHVEGPWYNIRGQDGDDLANCFSETTYVELLQIHLAKLLPRVPTDDPLRWFEEMDTHLRAAESWLLTNGAAQMLEHHADGITRRTFRPGQAPLVEFLTVRHRKPPSRSRQADPFQMQLSLAPDETPNRPQQPHGYQQPQPPRCPVLPEPCLAGPTAASRRKAATSSPDHPARKRAEKGGDMTQPASVPPKGFGCYRPDSIRARLHALEIGGSVVLTRKQEKAVGATAQRLGIRIACRRLGSKDTTTVYRIA